VGRRLMPRAPYDAVVVGAGPAGSSAAAMLARAGREVLLLEKDRFPRPKVCGEFLSASALERLEPLGLRASVLAEAESIQRGVIHPPFGGAAVPFALPRAGAGISREKLDLMLAARAAELGAETAFGARVTGVAGGPGRFLVRFRSGDGDEEVPALTVIGAWGRWDALDRAVGRPFPGAPSRFLGWSLDFAPGASLEGEVRLYVFPGGYCGLSRVEGGRVHLAGVVSEKRRAALGGGWPAVLLHARRSNPDFDRAIRELSPEGGGFRGAGPVRFAAKPPVENGILMVGDAAGVIDPFSGEGQASALASGILAADVVRRGFGGEIPLDAIPAEYARTWRAAFRRRFAWSAAFRRLMLSPTAGGWAARLAGPGVARFAIGRLGATSPSRPRR